MPVLNFALEEAQLRKAVLCVLYVKEIAVYFAGAPTDRSGASKWKDDPQARRDHVAHDQGRRRRAASVCSPVYAVSEDASATILDLAATMGVDYIILGASQRRTLARFA